MTKSELIKIINALGQGALALFSFMAIFFGLLHAPYTWPWLFVALPVVMVTCGTYLVYDDDPIDKLKQSWSELKDISWSGQLASMVKGLIAGFAAYSVIPEPTVGLLAGIMFAAIVYVVQASKLVEESKKLWHQDIRYLNKKQLLTESQRKERRRKRSVQALKMPLVLGHAGGQAMAAFFVLSTISGHSSDPAFLLFAVIAALLVGTMTGRFYGHPFLQGNSKAVGQSHGRNIRGMVLGHASALAKGALSFVATLSIFAYFMHLGSLTSVGITGLPPVAIACALFLGISTWWVQSAQTVPKFCRYFSPNTSDSEGMSPRPESSDLFLQGSYSTCSIGKEEQLLLLAHLSEQARANIGL